MRLRVERCGSQTGNELGNQQQTLALGLPLRIISNSTNRGFFNSTCSSVENQSLAIFGMLAILLIPAACAYTFGYINDLSAGMWAIAGLIGFRCLPGEQAGIRLTLGVDQMLASKQPGGI